MSRNKFFYLLVVGVLLSNLSTTKLQAATCAETNMTIGGMTYVVNTNCEIHINKNVSKLSASQAVADLKEVYLLQVDKQPLTMVMDNPSIFLNTRAITYDGEKVVVQTNDVAAKNFGPWLNNATTVAADNQVPVTVRWGDGYVLEVNAEGKNTTATIYTAKAIAMYEAGNGPKVQVPDKEGNVTEATSAFARAYYFCDQARSYQKNGASVATTDFSCTIVDENDQPQYKISYTEGKLASYKTITLLNENLTPIDITQYIDETVHSVTVNYSDSDITAKIERIGYSTRRMTFDSSNDLSDVLAANDAMMSEDVAQLYSLRGTTAGDEEDVSYTISNSEGGATFNLKDASNADAVMVAKNLAKDNNDVTVAVADQISIVIDDGEISEATLSNENVSLEEMLNVAEKLGDDVPVKAKASEIIDGYEGNEDITVTNSSNGTVVSLPEGTELTDEQLESLFDDEFEGKESFTLKIGDKTIQVANNVIVAPGDDYQYTAGQGQTYTYGQDKEASFTLNAPFNQFAGEVYVDDALLDSADYTAEEGSTVITLSKTFTEGLSEGNHTLKVKVLDGTLLETTFKVAKKQETKKTENKFSKPSNKNVPNHAKASEAVHKSCAATAVNETPVLFEIKRQGSEATLYVTPPKDASQLSVVYGYAFDMVPRFGGINLPLDGDGGVRAIKIGSLDKNVDYFFQVLGGNKGWDGTGDCTVMGNLSNVLIGKHPSNSTVSSYKD